jgi:hypothetical protein
MGNSPSILDRKKAISAAPTGATTCTRLRRKRRICLIESAGMKLITAHKILMGTATVFFVFFSLWELRNYAASGEVWALARSILYLIVAIGLGVYLKKLRRLYHLR